MEFYTRKKKAIEDIKDWKSQGMSFEEMVKLVTIRYGFGHIFLQNVLKQLNGDKKNETNQNQGTQGNQEL